jgi:epoxide hydrolase-like predicted phosphatase
MIKAIITDFGGVLTQSDGLRTFAATLATRYKKDTHKFTLLVLEKWQLAKVNSISSAQFWSDISKELSLDANTLRSESLEYFGWNPEMISAIKLLKPQYRIGLISNHIEDWLEYLLDTHKLRPLFDAIITSYSTRIAKPDKRIYMHCVHQLGVYPSDCVFIDDIRKNLIPAQELGMKTIHFTGTERCMEELEKMGIRLP